MSQLIFPIPKVRPSSQEVSEIVIGWLCNSSPDIMHQTANWRREHWEAARWSSWVHGIGPFLYKHLRKNPAFKALPESLQTYLATQRDLNGQRVASMMSELSILLKSAAQADIDVVPLKGSILISHYYDDATLRPMSDLDILIHPEDRERIDHLLTDLGYERLGRPLRHQKYILKHLPNRLIYNGEHPDNPRSLDVHTEIRENLLGIYCEVTEDLWSDSQLGAFGVATAILLSPIALFKHLLFHLGAHLREHSARFIQLLDIAVAASHLSHSEWLLLAQNIIQNRQEHIFYPPLFLAERYLSQIAPVEVIRRLAQGISKELRLSLQRTAFSYFSPCNPYPISPKDRLRWCRPGRERANALLYLTLSNYGRQNSIGWLLRHNLSLSRYYYFDHATRLLRLLRINR